MTPPELPRTRRVTLFGWAVILGSAVVMPVSVISLLMVLAGSYGTSRIEPLGALVILGGPPLAFAAGIGLLRRKRWARLCLIGLAAAALAHEAHQLTRQPTPETTTISPSGVRTTVSASTPQVSLPVTAAGLLALAVLLSPGVRREFAAAA